MESLYSTLGVEDYAPIEEVRKAYLAKILLVHPDKTHSEDGADLLAKLKHCYDKLKDPISKSAYDKWLREAKIHPEYFHSDIWSQKEKKIEVTCDQCASITEIVVEKEEGDVVVECEWCSHKYLINLNK